MKSRRQVLVFCLVFALFMAARPDAVTAGGKEFEPIDAQALIDACWAKSEEKLSSGVTALMRKGSMEIIRCLKNIILDQTEVLFDPKYLSRRGVEEKLDRIIKDYGGIYWSIYNEHRGCNISCGTMYHVFHYGPIESIFEKMIKDMISRRNEYQF